MRPLLLAIDAYAQPITRTALLLASLTALRPSVIASAQWAHIDMDAAEWHIPGALMKTRHDHIVPLPTQALALLEAIRGDKPGACVFTTT